MTLSNRSSIKSDMPGEIQTGDRPKILNVNETELKEVIIEHEEVVAGFSTAQFNIYPPVGTNARLYQMQLYTEAISIGDTSNHEFYVQLGTDTIVLLGESHKDEDIWFNYRHWYIADSEALPPGVDAQALAMESVIFNDVVELQIVYANNTPDDQEGGVLISLIMEVFGKWA